MRKIIILPEFSSSHILKYSIHNWISVIEPEIIIINSGIFPGGVENKKAIDENFKIKWCYEHTNAGFDYEEILHFTSKLLIEKYEGNKKIPHIQSRIVNYANLDVNECFLEAISTPDIFVRGDLIFPLEPDAFLFEGDKEIINEEISKLLPGQGLKCMWRDFLETQYYCEAINEIQPKHRRFCYCFDNLENYRSAIDGFMSQSYPKLEFTDKFWIRHYPWFVYDKWKELRYELIYRSDPQYWKDFENGLQEIRLVSTEFCKVLNEPDEISINWFTAHEGYIERNNLDTIMIRPSRQDEGRWAKFIDIEHPKHIKSHPNFVV